MANTDFSKQVNPPVLSLMLWTIACASISLGFPLGATAQLPLRPGAVTTPVGVRRSPQSYKLGGGDRIQVEILEVPELTRGYEVLSDGSVNLPLIGLISIRGRTLAEATTIIRNAYRRILKDPIVTVSLVAARPLNVGVIGEVTRPGNFTIALTPGPGVAPSVQYPTVTQALRLAEGVTGVADIRNIRVRRPQPDGPDQVLNVNLWKFLQEGDISQDIILQDRDTIVIPTVANFNQAEARQFAIANFSPPPEKPRSISIVGQVTRPGAYVVIGGNTNSDLSREGFPTVIRAIQLAGGITSEADIRQIQVRRVTRRGEQIIPVNLWQFLESGDGAQDTILQQGDTIIVPKATIVNPAEAGVLASTNFAPSGINVYVVGEVRTSLDPLRLPPNATLNQALVSRGFFGYENTRARRNKIELVRLNQDGTATKRTIEVDLTQGINEEVNPQLRNNDMIIVSRSGIVNFIDRMNAIVGPVGPATGVLNFINVLRSLFR
ncbi:MAG: polysaccharide biosynthesis/export family protein [Microcoleus sp. PH2017_40_RAT_O_B]|uniref:polysaccharide biosynthesis/export family protein n=1 Tax=unclassified Microcoleus TaxID=2642155 RepID=UPI001D451475|nr:MULTISPECIES: polysaccharide biosynthesis/export family protein [unclassified Microcoleus]MCC3572581.1 polysaccharide biosynthesis/export family protein [Microcoleus sp. PH2017_34_RAT_O_A]MCC3610243.1 polysaccharide biosynthesis/export family protein [Microcoleus sp. PH2017_40_RAT_O_B]